MSDERRFPRWVYGTGSDPDARFSLANERTFLAWIRTSLALLAGGVALEALALPVQADLRFAAAIVLVTLGVLALCWRGSPGRRPRPSGGLVAAGAVGVRAARRRCLRRRRPGPRRDGRAVTEPPPTLAAERTHLAWRRTAIGLAGGGLAAATCCRSSSVPPPGASLGPPSSCPSRWRPSRTAGTSSTVRCPRAGGWWRSSTAGVLVIGVAALAFVVLHGV